MPLTLDSETRDLLTLHLLPGLGPRLTQSLLNRFGSPSKVLQASVAELSQVPFLRDSVAESIATALRQIDTDRELLLMEQHDVELLRLGSPEYPANLATIHDPPQLLYVKGLLEAVDTHAVAIVGTRRYTSYGRRIAERLAEGLTRAGYTVISGLARGIDGFAHRAALNAGGRTIAVLAGGLARIYPPEHRDLAADIVHAGALLSEQPMNLEPLPQMFSPRNRLISGLSRGVIVVEAGAKSGALLTAQHAAEQGREVFAVPGPVDSEPSSGCLQLIRTGATLVRHVDDILEAFGHSAAKPGGQNAAGSTPAAPPRPAIALTEAQQKVLDALTDAVTHADDIVQRSGLGVAEVGNALTILEMHSLVRRLPGNRFEKRR